ncbi:MAG: hypothetical protein S4CHLAM7_00900 [Chlamydiae bacterium]|nr:hypothetical protein [Chlamydiota bacterium]
MPSSIPPAPPLPPPGENTTPNSNNAASKVPTTPQGKGKVITTNPNTPAVGRFDLLASIRKGTPLKSIKSSEEQAKPEPEPKNEQENQEPKSFEELMSSKITQRRDAVQGNDEQVQGCDASEWESDTEEEDDTKVNNVVPQKPNNGDDNTEVNNDVPQNLNPEELPPPPPTEEELAGNDDVDFPPPPPPPTTDA